jgi:hypothetical protein
MDCTGIDLAAQLTAKATEGFSSREIAESVIPEVARLSNGKPTSEIISAVCHPDNITPCSVTQADDLAAMRQQAKTLKRANNPEESVVRRSGRVVA